jgi:hypothetical protein
MELAHYYSTGIFPFIYNPTPGHKKWECRKNVACGSCQVTALLFSRFVTTIAEVTVIVKKILSLQGKEYRAVSITRYGVDGLGLESWYWQEIFIFNNCPDWLWGQQTSYSIRTASPTPRGSKVAGV